jgi:hypothetical protein
MRRLFIMIFAAAVVLIHAFPASAWWPIAHYSMQRELGVDQNQICMNLPDAWPNREYWIRITDWFAWSHGVQIDGYDYNVVPRSPTYPVDGRYPGYDIYQLATNKIRNANPQAQNTAFSFIGHNGMDRNVHFEYFRAGSINNWRVQHLAKEEWADYEIFVAQHGAGSFNQSGKAATFFGTVIDHDNPNQVLIPCSADARIIQIAQKVYRKNRRFTNTDNTGHISDVDTVETINARIQELQQAMSDEVRSLNFERFQELLVLASEPANNWMPDDLDARYQLSRLTATQRISGAGN